jgi:ligand-binding SRPBCC domain-containing protein
MTTYKIHRRQWVPQSLAKVFEFFAKAENLEELTPPFLRFQITLAPKRMEAGARIEYKLRVHGMPIRWRTVIEEWNPPLQFVDNPATGPYKLWHHTHLFWEENGGTWIEDRARYALPFGPIGGIVNRLLVARDVNGIFDYRARKVREIFGSRG